MTQQEAPPTYDFIFAGTGIAGLSLAYHLAQSSLGSRSMLLLDRHVRGGDNRTLSYWTQEPLYPELVHRSWDMFQVRSPTFQRQMKLAPWRYVMTHAQEFRRRVLEELTALPHVHLVQCNIQSIDNGPEQAIVETSNGSFVGRWVFDSRFSLKRFQVPPYYTRLVQSFHGWWVETEDSAFDTEVPTLMDFCASQEEGVCFYYVLPETTHRALVECVHFAPEPRRSTPDQYLQQQLGLRNYRITAEEWGVTPMTDWPFPRQTGQRILTLGIAGGRIKSSTGYAFTRMERDSQHIVRSLEQHGHPFALPKASRWYLFLDSVMLDVIARHKERMVHIFTALFRNNPAPLVLRFLEEQASWRDHLRIIASLPPWWFIGAIFRWMGRAFLSTTRRAMASLRFATRQRPKQLPPSPPAGTAEESKKFKS